MTSREFKQALREGIDRGVDEIQRCESRNGCVLPWSARMGMIEAEVLMRLDVNDLPKGTRMMNRMEKDGLHISIFAAVLETLAHVGVPALTPIQAAAVSEVIDKRINGAFPDEHTPRNEGRITQL